MLDSLLRFAIAQRLLVVILTFAAGWLGIYSLQRLPIDAVPDITNNQVQINTQYSGFSPIDVEKQITYPIETALAGIAGLDYTRSLSRNGFSQVTAVFHDEVDIYFARQQVIERLVEAREALPPGAEPRLGPIATGLGEVYMWAVVFDHPRGTGLSVPPKDASGWQANGSYRTSEGRLLQSDLELMSYLREVQDWLVRPQIKSVEGVAGVDAIGGYVKQFHVQPEPHKLLALGITFSDLTAALERNNVSIGAGYIERQGQSYVVRADGRIADQQQIGDIVIGTRDGTPIRVREVADVAIGKELRTGSASRNGVETVIGTALMRIGENSRTVASAVNARIAEINSHLPPDIHLVTLLNRTELVDATIATVRKNLIEGAVLVIIVLMLILGELRAAILTALIIPLSMLLAATGMVRAHISGNLMSLGAIDFGLIVDGAVIIVENSLRHLAERQQALGRPMSLEERLEEVFVASKQVIQPSVFGQAIIMTVYVPILSLSGVEGKMFHPMAATVILALLAAFVLSLTFVPAMTAMLFSGRLQESESWFVHLAKQYYAPLLERVLQRRWQVIAGAAFAFLCAIGLFTRLGQEFVPTLDEKNLAVQAARVPSTSLTQAGVMQATLERTLGTQAEIAHVFSKTGTAEMATDPMPPNLTDTFVMLKPRTEWPDPGLTKNELIERLSGLIGQLPGNLFEFTQPIQLRFNELIAGVRGDVAIKIYGEEFSVMESLAQSVSRTLATVEGATDIKVEQTQGLPVINIAVDRQTIARYGLSMSDVQEVLAIAVGGRATGYVFEGDRRFELLVRLPEHLRGQVNELERLPIPLPAGSSATAATAGSYLPLSEIARIEIAEGPNQVSRENGKRRIVVQANVRGRDLGSFIEAAQQEINEKVSLPPGYTLEWGGQFENLVKAKARLSLVVPVCFLLILALLFSAFGSFKQSLVIFSGVPFALIGGILALWIRSMPFSISAAIGFIALSGVAVLNGLVLVSFINQLHQGGLSLDLAIRQGAATRLRPVLMTALIASLGFVPMAIATGTGAEVQKPLATVVIGGLISSTLLTLLVLPAIYRAMHRTKPKADAPLGIK